MVNIQICICNNILKKDTNWKFLAKTPQPKAKVLYGRYVLDKA